MDFESMAKEMVLKGKVEAQTWPDRDDAGVPFLIGYLRKTAVEVLLEAASEAGRRKYVYDFAAWLVARAKVIERGS